jgi:hypothetical protein
MHVMWPASPTPDLRQGTPRTYNRNCGSQPAHQSLITDVYSPASSLTRSSAPATTDPWKRKRVLPLKNGHQSVQFWKNRVVTPNSVLGLQLG